MPSEYMIGLTELTMAPVDDLFARAQDCEPRGEPMDYTEVVEVASGARRGFGWLRQKWHFDFVGETYRNNLFAFANQRVYVHTRKNDGTFGYFTGVFTWPEREPEHIADRVLDLTVELVALEPFEVA